MAKQLTIKKVLKYSFTYVVSLIGALGTGLQNYMAVAQLIKDLMHAGFAASNAGLGIIHGVAVGLGAICSGIVNFMINIDLLKSFWKRLMGKKGKPQLPTLWSKIQYYGGSALFILAGIVFGVTAFVFGPVGPLMIAAIAAGIFVAIIMTIQELETWLKRFDPPSENAAQETPEKPVSKSKVGKVIGHIIAGGNVFALTLLLTFGVAAFCTALGAPLLVAVIVGFAVAAVVPAITEFYFYNYFISEFCEKIESMWKEFWDSKKSGLGLAASIVNAAVNGVLCYVGIMNLFTTCIAPLLVASSIFMPPIAIIIAIAVIASAFAAAASFLLGVDFWRSNYKVEEQPMPEAEKLLGETDTAHMLDKMNVELSPVPAPVVVELQAAPAPTGLSSTPSNDSRYQQLKFFDHYVPEDEQAPAKQHEPLCAIL